MEANDDRGVQVTRRGTAVGLIIAESMTDEPDMESVFRDIEGMAGDDEQTKTFARLTRRFLDLMIKEAKRKRVDLLTKSTPGSEPACIKIAKRVNLGMREILILLNPNFRDMPELAKDQKLQKKFLKQRRKAVASLDPKMVERFVKRWRLTFPNLTPSLLEIVLRRALTMLTDAPFRKREASARWLIKKNIDPLDDGDLPC